MNKSDREQHPPITQPQITQIGAENRRKHRSLQRTQNFFFALFASLLSLRLCVFLCASALILASFVSLAPLALTPLRFSASLISLRLCVNLSVLCISWRPWRYYPPIDPDSHRKHRSLQRTQNFFFALFASLLSLRLCVFLCASALILAPFVSLAPLALLSTD